MSARFEIVRTDAGWHNRLVAENGRTLASSENFTRRVGAERNLVALVCHLAGGVWGMQENAPGVEWVLVDHVDTVHDVTVRYLDERTPDRSRPGLGTAGVTGAQPDEPASQAGRPVAGGAS